jgi:hypothetical protein
MGVRARAVVLLLIIGLVAPPWASALAQEVTRIRQFGSADFDEATGVAVDGAGGVYVVGSTFGTLAGLTSAGDLDAFVRKYDSSGNAVWTRQFGSSEFDEAFAVAVDPAGSVYVVGSTFGTLSGQASAGDFDVFVRKFDPNGTTVWTRQFGSADFDEAFGVAVDSVGSIYVVGSTFGALAGQPSAGDFDAFVRKYDSSGNVVWSRQFGSSSLDEGRGVAVDRAGSLYVVGFTNGVLPGQAPAGSTDGFVRKYDLNGVEVWTRQFGAATSDEATSVAVGGTGSVYVAGLTDPQLLGGGFVRKYDADGTVAWARQLETSSDFTVAVAADASGNAYVAANTFDALPGQTSAGLGDAFVRKYDASGNAVWTRQFGSSEFDEAFGVAVDRSEGIYVVGSTDGSLPGQGSAGSRDAFLARLSQPRAADTAAPDCRLAGTGADAQGRQLIRVSAQDTGSGLVRISVLKQINADVAVPPFAAGTKDTIVVTATKRDPALSAQVQLEVADVAGNKAVCDPVLVTVRSDGGVPETETLTGIPQAEGRVTLKNGSPGLRTLIVAVNGRRFVEGGLRDGEERTVDIAAALRPGEGNTIALTAIGRRGASADILIWDGHGAVLPDRGRRPGPAASPVPQGAR